MMRKQRSEMNTRNRNNKISMTQDSILPVAVCASTFRKLYGRDATSAELSEMTGIAVPTLIGLYMPAIISANHMELSAAAVC